MEKSNQYPNELCVSGTYLGGQKEHREWVKDGIAKSMDLDCIFVQSSFGVCVLRFFNSKVDLTKLKTGDSVCFPVESYQKENGIKAFVVRM